MKTMILMLAAVLIGVSGESIADEKALNQRMMTLARKVSMQGHQISSMGITGTMYLTKPERKYVKGKMDFIWVSDGAVDGVLRKAQGAKAGKHVDMTGRPYGGRDITTVVISWSGKAWPMGKIQYQTTQGLLRTCPLWTADEKEAFAFYRKHGFTQAAKDAVMKAN